MPEEFEGDLAGAVFWGADLKGAQFRDVDLTGARIGHAWLIDVEVDALVDRLVVNGVDVTAYVNEHDPWYPLRTMTRVTDAAMTRSAWAAFDEAWAATIARAQVLPEDRLHESVDGEWSFVETLRHLVFAIDKWFTAPFGGGDFHPIGLPNRGSIEFPWPGLDLAASVSVAEALAAFADRSTRLRDFLASVTDEDLTRSIDILENGPNPMSDCIGTVFEEAFWHNRYALRDLATLESRDA